MKFSENWLRSLVDVKVSREQLIDSLTMAGLEVESVQALGQHLQNVRVGEILTCEPHPDAKRLQICQVNTGADEPTTIVCGAPNVRVGLKAPLALPGAVLPNGVRIECAELRGVASAGMLCSADELQIDADASGLFELPEEAVPGQSLSAVLGLPDASIELTLTPNRADCFSMLGLAYDVAALFDAGVRTPPCVEVPIQGDRHRQVRLEAGQACPRYLGRVIEGVDPQAPIPIWMQQRLLRAGLRPVNAVVDVANYVMLELGQPLHTFDNDRLHGEIHVRLAQTAESIRLLGDLDVSLDSDMLLIADDHGPIALAGIMGGADSAVQASTRTVFLESAHFAPASIMGVVRRLGLHSDAAHRFERGVDPELPSQALQRASGLLIAIAGGKASTITVAEHLPDIPSRLPIRLRNDRVERILGMAIADAEIERILTALDMRLAREQGAWIVVPPSRRFDIECEEDLIEEIARIHGYDRIPVSLPVVGSRVVTEPETRVGDSMFRDALCASDYLQAIHYAFVSSASLEVWGLQDAAVPLANPLSAEFAVMRTSLLPGLAASVQANRNRQQSRVRLFELGRTFQQGSDGEAPTEIESLAGMMVGTVQPEHWHQPLRNVDFYDIKGDVETLLALTGESGRYRFEHDHLPLWLHPGRGARLLADGRSIGALGALHPQLLNKLGMDGEVYAFELCLGALRDRRLPKARSLNRFPSVRRDLALVVNEAVSWADVEQIARQAAGELLTRLELFDLYRGQGLPDGRKSFAISLILQESSRTLTDEEVDTCMQKVMDALLLGVQAEFRG